MERGKTVRLPRGDAMKCNDERSTYDFPCGLPRERRGWLIRPDPPIQVIACNTLFFAFLLILFTPPNPKKG